ncbi:hypothetical protein NDU88_002747 [Pleurodeles waltl]|uniref:Uncharacterized protein n=1 Tax=Pleurodeles waltl TaxID=8319 RepID=A0AAV7UZR8_PLEWA|nr:hypothetical protein NDU88_002747 [Pleurodeles waltl]
MFTSTYLPVKSANIVTAPAKKRAFKWSLRWRVRRCWGLVCGQYHLAIWWKAASCPFLREAARPATRRSAEARCFQVQCYAFSFNRVHIACIQRPGDCAGKNRVKDGHGGASSPALSGRRKQLTRQKAARPWGELLKPSPLLHSWRSRQAL